MLSFISLDRLRFHLAGLRERLWFKPLVICLLSISGGVIAKVADGTPLSLISPPINIESIETLLSILASSMLMIATFAVSSMVSAYSSASSTATPRAFALVLADDVSQSALSRFIGAFIFSIVALTAIKNGYFGSAGRFILFIQTAGVFAIVIFTFVRWVDRIARLGRLSNSIEKVELATAAAMRRRRDVSLLYCTPQEALDARGEPVFASKVGYVVHVDMALLQACAEQAGGRVTVAALPGTFAAPDRALAYVNCWDTINLEKVTKAFLIGDERRFDDDPRFGLVVLSEIAGRALSPAVNDPGTAIGIVGALVRLFTQWSDSAPPKDASTPKYDCVEVPELSVRDMFDDAFTPIARDGAGIVEVMLRLMKALHSLSLAGDIAMHDAAMDHARMALVRAERVLDLPEDLAVVRAFATFVKAAEEALSEQASPAAEQGR